jgi:hypothetical protein
VFLRVARHNESVTPAALAAHDRATADGRDYYTDPDTGLLVMTRLYLQRRGYCCGNVCRHCPYRDEETDPVD